MIDTCRLYCKLDKISRKEIKRSFKPVRKKSLVWYLNSESNGLMLYYMPVYNMLFIRCNLKKTLNKSIIVNEDYDFLVNKINETLNKYFSDIRFNKFKLSRIDFKKDIVTTYKKEYIEILKKLNCTYRRKNKKIYETSVYYRGRSYNLNLYDKEAEAGLSFKNEYKDVLRLEVQLKSIYLKNLYKNTGLQISLDNFFSFEMRDFIFSQILEPLFKKGDYYTVAESEKILKETYSDNMINKLLNFQKLIYRYDLTYVKKTMSENTYYRYLKCLKFSEVNPIIFQSTNNIKCLPNLMKYLEGNI